MAFIGSFLQKGVIAYCGGAFFLYGPNTHQFQKA